MLRKNKYLKLTKKEEENESQDETAKRDDEKIHENKNKGD